MRKPRNWLSSDSFHGVGGLALTSRGELGLISMGLDGYEVNMALNCLRFRGVFLFHYDWEHSKKLGRRIWVLPIDRDTL